MGMWPARTQRLEVPVPYLVQSEFEGLGGQTQEQITPQTQEASAWGNEGILQLVWFLWKSFDWSIGLEGQQEPGRGNCLSNYPFIHLSVCPSVYPLTEPVPIPLPMVLPLIPVSLTLVNRNTTKSALTQVMSCQRGDANP